jgi:hypothetical protein
MENLDIIVLTSILSTLFVVFSIVVYKELKNLDLNETEERGPRADFVRFIGNLFDDGSVKKMNPKQKAVLYKQVKRTISDMESDGVYFPKEVKQELKRKRDEMTCEYSGLRSVMSYLEEDEYYNGHS